MSVIDEIIRANQKFARDFDPGDYTQRPRKHLALLTCMDTRLTIASLGLHLGDAHIIRNAGGIASEDALRSLIISHHLLGTTEAMVVNHTDCGLMKMGEDEFREHISARAQADAQEPAAFHAFRDIEANVREQLRRIRSHPWLSELHTRGFVYHVETGLLQEIQADESALPDSPRRSA